MDQHIASLLSSLHDRIKILEAKYSADDAAKFLIRQACHAWIGVSKRMGASEEEMRTAVQNAVKEAMKGVDSYIGLEDSIRSADLPIFFQEFMKNQDAVIKARGMIKGWIFELLAAIQQ